MSSSSDQTTSMQFQYGSTGSSVTCPITLSRINKIVSIKIDLTNLQPFQNTTGSTQRYLYGVCQNVFPEFLPLTTDEYCIGHINIVQLTGSDIFSNVNTINNGDIYITKNTSNQLEVKIYFNPNYGTSIAQGVFDSGYACVGGTWITSAIYPKYLCLTYTIS